MMRTQPRCPQAPASALSRAIATAVLGLLMAAPSAAVAGSELFENPAWTSWFSEEKVPGSPTGHSDGRLDVISKLACNGRYCDNIRLFQGTGRLLADQPGYWTGYFSEEQGSKVCSSGDFVRRMRCKGSYCDEIDLYCAPLPAGYTQCSGTTMESSWVSDEQGSSGKGCPDGSFLTGAKCKGRYCDRKKLYCHKICNSGVSREMAVSYIWQHITNNPGVSQEFTLTVSNEESFQEATENIRTDTQSWSVEVEASYEYGAASGSMSSSFAQQVEQTARHEVISTYQQSTGAEFTTTYDYPCPENRPHLWAAVYNVDGKWPGDWTSQAPSLNKIMCTKNDVAPACPFGSCKAMDEDIGIANNDNCQTCCTNKAGDFVACGGPEDPDVISASRKGLETTISKKYRHTLAALNY